HTAADITEDATHRFVTDAEKTGWAATKTTVDAAASANTASTLVVRDGAGSFSGEEITAESGVRLKDNDTNYVTIEAPVDVTTDVTYVLPVAPSAGEYLTTD